MLTAIIFSSCATIEHQRSIVINVKADVADANICINNDTTRWYVTPATIAVKRSKKPLLITAKKDTIEKTFAIKSTLSTAFLLGNIYCGGLLGYGIDLTNNKRFNYPDVTLHLLAPEPYFTKNRKRLFPVTALRRSQIIAADEKNNKFLIKFCPLALMDEISFPTIQGGIEFKLSNNITWYNEIGIKYKNSYIDSKDSGFIKSAGFKLKTEIRYYFERENNLSFDGYYFAANAFFIKDHHNSEIGYRADSAIRTDAFGVKKNVYGVNLVFGQQSTIAKRFLVDLYCGLGIRYRSIRTNNEEYNKATDVIIRPIDINIPAMRLGVDANGGNSTVANLTMGIRICYKF